MLLKDLQKKSLIHPPNWLTDSCQYLCIMGSFAYGVSGDDSDSDIYGFCVPPKDLVFPHTAGEIPGFGKQIKRFEQWQEHHVKTETKEYDFSVYSIVKFFQLCMENNPNMCDALFVPERCIVFQTPIGQRVRENRKLFLHKGSFQKFKGYAYQMLHKMSIKVPEIDSKRYEMYKKYGFDTKFSYHLVRLLLEAEQILTTQDLNLECNSEVLKAIRRGEWAKERVEKFFEQKESELETLYNTSPLQYSPDEPKIKKLLLECLEQYYGSLDNAYIEPDRYKNALKEIESVCSKLDLYK